MPRTKVNKSAELEKKVATLTDALQRERADAENLRRRFDEQINNLRNMVKVAVISDLLPALDNLQLALNHTPKDIAGHDYVKGVQSVVKQFDKALVDLGVQRIKSVGEHFDPKLHEAVSAEGEDDALGGGEIITNELSSGYKLGDEIIRHARVKVKMENRS